MTFKQLQDDALDRLDFDPTVTTTTQGTPRYRIKAYINEWYRRILARPGMEKQRDIETTIALVAGTNEYTIAATVQRVMRLTEQTTGWRLEERSLDWFRRADPRESATGVPTHYAMRSRNKVYVWPTPAAVGTLTLEGTATITELSGDADVPVLHEDFHWLLSAGARVNEYERLDDSRSQALRQDLEHGIRELRFELSRRASATVPGIASAPGFSRLGGFYPRGS